MKPQILKHKDGNSTGVYISIEDWKLIKSIYPEIEEDMVLSKHEKEFIDQRLLLIKNNPERLLDR